VKSREPVPELNTRVTIFDWSVVCGNSRSNSNFDNLVNSDRRNVYINFLEYFYIEKFLINIFIFNINIFDAANSFYLKKYTNIHITLAAFE